MINESDIRFICLCSDFMLEDWFLIRRTITDGLDLLFQLFSFSVPFYWVGYLFYFPTSFFLPFPSYHAFLNTKSVISRRQLLASLGSLLWMQNFRTPQRQWIRIWILTKSSGNTYRHWTVRSINPLYHLLAAVTNRSSTGHTWHTGMCCSL